MNHNYYLLQYYRVTDTLELQLNPTFLGQAQQLKLVCTFYILNLWVAKLNSHTHTCVHVRTCVMCVRKGFQSVRAMCVRAADLRCVTCESNFARFWVKKGPNFGLFWAKFASKLPFCHKRACAGAKWILGKTHTCVRCACGRKSSVRMCVRARHKIVATHSLGFC